MAITKVLHMSADFDRVIGSHLDNAIEYILQEKKLGKANLSGGINCMTSGTYEQMMDTKKLFGKTGGRQGYHFIISLKPGEGTPQEMYEIAMRFAERAFQNEYEAVVAVHTDKEHLHAHVIINSVNMVTGKKFQYKNGDWKRIYQPITNELCEEYGLSIVPAEYNTEAVNVSHDEYRQNRKFKAFILEDCECLLALSEDTDHFIWLLKRLGYEVKEGVHIAVRLPGMKRFARLDTLDGKYARETLESSIERAKGREILFPVRSFNTDNYRSLASNVYQKRYYYQIRGIRVVDKYRFGYKAAKYYKDILLLQKLQEEYLFLCHNNIHSFEDLLDYRSNAVDELEQIHLEQQEIYNRNLALKRKCGTPEGLREYQAEHIRNGQRLDELKKRGGELRKGKRLAERLMSASINEALERIGRDYPAESLEIDPSVSDVPEYPVAVTRLKAEKERREAEARAKAEKERQEAEERAEAAKRKAKEQAKREHFNNLHKKMKEEGEKLVNAAYEFPFDKPYKWDYIHYIDDRRFKPVSMLTEEEMAEPFLTYEEFVAMKDWEKGESAVSEQIDGRVSEYKVNEQTITDIAEQNNKKNFVSEVIPKADIKDGKDRDIPQSFIGQTEQSRIYESHSEQSDVSQKESPVFPTERIVSIPEPSAAKPMKKTSVVTKKDYDKMTDKEKADWVGIDMKDLSGSIDRFKQKMKQLGITYGSIPEMSDDFMKLYNALEKMQDTLEDKRDYQRVLRR